VHVALYRSRRNVDDLQRERAREWLRERRGSTSQQALVEDINRTLSDWTITRDRYSKYESGATPFGLVVLTRFVDYWERKGVPGGPDFTPPEPTPEPPDLATALLALATELRAWREERESIEGRLRAAESELESLRAQRAAEGRGARSAPPSTAGSGR
jgi:hypothetical protein